MLLWWPCCRWQRWQCTAVAVNLYDPRPNLVWMKSQTSQCCTTNMKSATCHATIAPLTQAALNMMTRTSAAGYAKDRIYMNSVARFSQLMRDNIWTFHGWDYRCGVCVTTTGHWLDKRREPPSNGAQKCQQTQLSGPTFLLFGYLF